MLYTIYEQQWALGTDRQGYGQHRELFWEERFRCVRRNILMNSLLKKFTFSEELTDVIENCKGVSLSLIHI